jgi:hypothetical protein
MFTALCAAAACSLSRSARRELVELLPSAASPAAGVLTGLTGAAVCAARDANDTHIRTTANFMIVTLCCRIFRRVLRTRRGAFPWSQPFATRGGGGWAVTPCKQFTPAWRPGRRSGEESRTQTRPVFRVEQSSLLHSRGRIQHDVQRLDLRRLNVLIHQEALPVGGHVVAEDVGGRDGCARMDLKQ